MNYPKRKHALPGWLGAGASLFCILSIFFRPAAAAQGVLNGLSL